MGAPKAAATPAAAPLDTKSRLSLRMDKVRVNTTSRYTQGVHLPVRSKVGIGKFEPIEPETPELRDASSYDGATVNHRTLLTDKKT